MYIYYDYFNIEGLFYILIWENVVKIEANTLRK